jgi:hypothetical protein
MTKTLFVEKEWLLKKSSQYLAKLFLSNGRLMDQMTKTLFVEKELFLKKMETNASTKTYIASKNINRSCISIPLVDSEESTALFCRIAEMFLHCMP